MGVSTMPPWSRRSTGLGSGESFSRERCVRASVVVEEVVAQQATQVVLVQHDDVVEALAAQGPDEAFHVRILPRGPRRRLDFVDPHGLGSAREHDPVHRIAVAQEVARGSLPGERLHELLGRPLGRGGVGDVDVDDASPLVRQDHEDEQDLEHHRGHDEEVHGDEAPQVVVEKGPPSLRWRPSMADQVLGYRRLGDLEAQLLEFPVNPRRAPRGLAARHLSDERSDLRGDGRTAGPVPAALPGPEELEAGPLPANDGGGLDDGDGIRPAAPQAGQQDPEQPVGPPQAWTRRRALEDGQLVPQREVLEDQGAVGPDPAEEADEDEGDHAGHHRSSRLKVNVDKADGVK